VSKPSEPAAVEKDNATITTMYRALRIMEPARVILDRASNKSAEKCTKKSGAAAVVCVCQKLNTLLA
jgi:Fe2+ or Zn2+ uptake regulation protein